MVKTSVVVLLLLFAVFSNSPAQTDFNVITGKWLEHSDAGNSLYRYFTGLAYEQLQHRRKIVDSACSGDMAGLMERQLYIRKKLMECTGPFPEKTSLNAKIVKTVEKQGFRVEHIIFESVPGFYVTSSLFLPADVKRKTRLPVVIYCSGHSAESYRSAAYQLVILNLVRKGFAVFAFDPVGQGERLEYYDPETGKSAIGGPTSEHSYPGGQAFLTGNSQAKIMIWDGIRSVDYLLTRSDIDPERIGITGRSGGGTQSAYIAAFDERIRAAAPENYITTYERLLQTRGPQDAEQNLTGFISRGLDHADFLIVRAPKPAMMITTTNDMFSIQGAMETEREVAAVYSKSGFPENFSRVEDDAGHASTRRNRESLYSFFQKHLLNPGNPSDEEVTLLTPAELRVTESGQVSVSLRSETVFSLNRRYAVELGNLLDISRSDPGFSAKAVKSAELLSGYVHPVAGSQPVFTGRILTGEYSIERYFVKGYGGYVIPYLLFRPAVSNGEGAMYLHPDGKAAQAEGEIASLAAKGYVVLAPDLPGTGETGPGDLRGDAYFGGASHNLWYAGILTGKTITGVRAADIELLAAILKKEGVNEITGISKGDMAAPLLHSAVFTGMFNKLILAEPYVSWMSIVTSPRYNPFFLLSAVPGALQKYDLPDLAAALSPRKLVIAGAVDGMGSRKDTDGINRDLKVIRAAYDRQNASASLVIKDSPEWLSEL
jgi:cephalosporin-C deacetylase-like acetyl esterase